MRATVFVKPGHLELREKPIPDVGANDALVRITLTTICGTEVHILRGEYPVAEGRTIGHEPEGVVHKSGSSVQSYQERQRVSSRAPFSRVDTPTPALKVGTLRTDKLRTSRSS